MVVRERVEEAWRRCAGRRSDAGTAEAETAAGCGVLLQPAGGSMGAMDATLKAGLRVPGGYCVYRLQNLRYAELRVPLSSIDHGTAELGRIAGELRAELSAKPEQEPRSILGLPRWWWGIYGEVVVHNV